MWNIVVSNVAADGLPHVGVKNNDAYIRVLHAHGLDLSLHIIVHPAYLVLII